MSVAAWGASEQERHARSPADDALPDASERWVRAIDVAAPPALTWRWLCQLKAAPYSYDWIDNLGRRSPQELQPGLEEVEVGQKLLIAFRIESFAPEEHLTVVARPRSGLLPPFAMAYVLTPTEAGSRITVHLRVRAPRALPRPVARVALAGLCAGDLVMMRKQLLNLKRLAERDAARARAAGSAASG